MLKYFVAALAIAASLSFAADAEAFGGRGYARRQTRRVYYPVVVPRVAVVPVARVSTYYRAPAYRPPVSINIGTGGYRPYGGFYGSGYRGYGYPSYRGGGVSIGIGW
ncbi:hypothetical protein Poly51_47440 [Rubripirellula tenax]|uniref:Uncharacterized protein n=1 Tax=Rubripirellula tenax TaxID=2528015 RepID=A0A5C6EK06_9BACT|nr:hypothetical protein [Rubripirellula tenax]TWU48840.1 hypothetical protein Poly51_47440 [Rubripirellula tenax]